MELAQTHTFLTETWIFCVYAQNLKKKICIIPFRYAEACAPLLYFVHILHRQNLVILNRIYLINIKRNQTRLSTIKQYGNLSCLAKSQLERYYGNFSLFPVPFVFSFETVDAGPEPMYKEKMRVPPSHPGPGLRLLCAAGLRRSHDRGWVGTPCDRAKKAQQYLLCDTNH